MLESMKMEIAIKAPVDRRGARDDVHRGPSGRGGRSDLRAATDGGGRACLTGISLDVASLAACLRGRRPASGRRRRRCRGADRRARRRPRVDPPPFRPARSADTVRALDGKDPATLPLYGVPFAIKATTSTSWTRRRRWRARRSPTPRRGARRRSRGLLAAGAIPIGKTNLDQFATGLVGVRSPYGVPANPFDAALHPGRLELRLGRRGRGGARELRARHRHGGLRARARRLHQRRRPQAYARTGQHDAASFPPAARSTACRFSRSRAATPPTSSPRSRASTPRTVFSRPLPRREPAEVAPRFRFECRGPKTSRSSTPRPRSSSRSRRLASRRPRGEPVTIDLEPFVEVGRLLYGDRGSPNGGRRSMRASRGILEWLHPVIRDVIAGGIAPDRGRRVHGVLPPPRAPTYDGSRLGPDRRAADADRADHPADRGGPRRPDRPERAPRSLHDLREPARPRSARDPGGLPPRRAPVRGVARRAGVPRGAACSALGHRLHAAAGSPVGATSHPVPEPEPSRPRAPATGSRSWSAAPT